jgi:hypothetical protein
MTGDRSTQRSGTASGFRQSVALPSLASAVARAATPAVCTPNHCAKIVDSGLPRSWLR